MDAPVTDIVEYTLWLVWTCLTLTPAALKNSVFLILMGTEAVLEKLLSDSLLTFAPGLFDVFNSAVPPTIAYFKSLPTDVGRCWGIYLIVLEKPGYRPKIYIGSSTNSTRGISARFYCYDARVGLPIFVESVLDDGYTVTWKGLLCWSPIPDAGSRFPVAALIHALEATFSIVRWAMKSRTKDYGMPHLCPWRLDTMEYDGLCSHSALDEGVRTELDGLTPKQRAAKEVEMEQRRIAQFGQLLPTQARQLSQVASTAALLRSKA